MRLFGNYDFRRRRGSGAAVTAIITLRGRLESNWLCASVAHRFNGLSKREDRPQKKCHGATGEIQKSRERSVSAVGADTVVGLSNRRGGAVSIKA